MFIYGYASFYGLRRTSCSRAITLNGLSCAPKRVASTSTGNCSSCSRRCFRRAHPGVVHIHFDVKLSKLAHDVHDASVAQIGTVFLEGQAHHEHPCSIDLDAFARHCFDQLRRERGSERAGIARSTTPISAKLAAIREPSPIFGSSCIKACLRICRTSSSIDRLCAAARKRRLDFNASSTLRIVKLDISRPLKYCRGTYQLETCTVDLPLATCPRLVSFPAILGIQKIFVGTTNCLISYVPLTGVILGKAGNPESLPSQSR